MAWQDEAPLPRLLSCHPLIDRSVPSIGDLRVFRASTSFDWNRILEMVGGRAVRSAAHSGW